MNPGVSPFLARGFRPFFTAACLFAMVVMGLWLHAQSVIPAGSAGSLPAFQWHAHEMIYGYAVSVIAGFLLTATQNWTGRTTLNGSWLGVLLLLWATARIAMLPQLGWHTVAAVCDLAFLLGLLLAIAVPIIAVRQKRQAPVLIILLLLLAGNGIFHLGLQGFVPNGVTLGIRLGFYLVLGLVLFMGRRVIPFFAEGGTGQKVEIPRPRWIDGALIALYPVFLVLRVFFPAVSIEWIAAALFLITLVQLFTWHISGIWKKPLLWSLYLAFGMISLGFGLLSLARTLDISESIALHAFSVGGIGLITISMMARVSLGHTGRNIHEASFRIFLALLLLLVAAVLRTMLPVVIPSGYLTWVTAAGVFWIMAFGCLAMELLPMLTKPRIDGKPG